MMFTSVMPGHVRLCQSAKNFGFAATVTLISAKSCATELVAVSRSTYVPGWSKVTVVAGFAAFPKVAVPGPLTLLHAVVSVPAMSLLAVPVRFAATPFVALGAVPQDTVGAKFPAATIATSLAGSARR